MKVPAVLFRMHVLRLSLQSCVAPAASFASFAPELSAGHGYASHLSSKTRYRDYLQRVSMTPSSSPLGADGGPPFGDGSYSLWYVDSVLRHGTRMPPHKPQKQREWAALLQDTGLGQALYGRAKTSEWGPNSQQPSNRTSILDLLEDDANAILIEEGWREHLMHGRAWARALAKWDGGRSSGNVIFGSSEKPRCVTSAKAFRTGLFEATMRDTDKIQVAGASDFEGDLGKVAQNALQLQREYLAQIRFAAPLGGRKEDSADGANARLWSELVKDDQPGEIILDNWRMRFYSENKGKKDPASDIAKQELDKFLNSDTFLRVSARVSELARGITRNPDLDIPAKTVAELFDLGSQEFAVLGRSPLQEALFSEAETYIANEHIKDLKYFYKNGPGNQGTRRWQPRIFGDWYDGLARAALDNEPLFRFAFGHESTILQIISWLGAVSEVLDAPGLAFQTSLLVPFASHLSIVLWRSTHAGRPALVQVLLNGRSLRLSQLTLFDGPASAQEERHFYLADHLREFLGRSVGEDSRTGATGASEL